jgi:linearmycin/streptolysin S transport system permease protein
LARDRIGLFFTFLLPIMIILLLGAAVPGGDLQLGVVQADDGPLAAALVTALRQTDGVQITTYGDVDALQRAVRRTRVNGGVVVPSGYDAALRGGEQARLTLVVDPASNDAAAVRARVDAVVADQSSAVLAARVAQQLVPGADFDASLGRAEAVGAAVGTVTVTSAGSEGFRSVTVAAYATIGELVLFIFLIGLTGAGDLVETRQLGVSRRELAAPVAPRTIVAGEGLGRFLIAVAQAVVIVLFTRLLFRIDWGDLLGVLLVIAAFGLVAAAASLLVGTVARTPEQATSFGPLVGIALGMLGGCMWPLEIVPPGLQRVGHLTPQSWAIDALVSLMGERASAVDVLPQVGVLCLFAAVLVPLAVWRFRRSITGR